MSVTSAELLAIRVEMQGAKKAAEESLALAKAQKGIGTSTTVAGNAAVSAEKKTSRLSKTFHALGKMARWGMAGLAIGGAAVALWGKKAVSSSTELAKATISLHKNLGLSVLKSSEWASVAKVRGADTTKLGMAFKTLAGAITTARDGSSTGVTMFKRLGFSMSDIRRGAKDTNFLVMKTADGLAHLKAGADKTAISGKLFGRGWQNISPLLRDGSKKLKESLTLAKESGAVFTDEKGLNGVYAIVEAERKLELANAGLQLAFTKALGPSIIKVTEWMGQFVRVLNDPKLSADQKVNHITKMFEGLTDKLVEIVSEALPKVAEGAGKIGVAMAGAIWTGFKNSNFLGKLVISAWLFTAMGGGTLIRAAGAKVGGMVMSSVAIAFANRFPILTIMMQDWASGAGKLTGRAFMVGLVAGVALLGVWLGVKLGEILEEKTHGAFHRWAVREGKEFVNTFASTINDVTDALNPFAALGVDAPNVPEVGLSPEERMHNGEHITHHHLPHGQIPPGSEGPGITTPRPRANKINFKSNLGGGGGRLRPIIVQSILDGQVIAESTARVADDEAAFGR